MNRPTMQLIADRLSISRISVWKALNNRPGVSKSLRDKIILTAEELGYFNKSAPAPSSPAYSSRTIAAIVTRPESSVFWMQIIHQLAKELSRLGYNMMYTYLPTRYREGYQLPSALKDGSVAGAIILNTYSEPLLKMISSLKIPKVFLDTMPSVPFSDINGDLVLLEGRCVVQEITTRLLEKGYTNLSFIGDINYAQTNMDRYLGFIDAHKQNGLEPSKNLILTGSLGLSTHYQEISSFLDTLTKLPDGFVCASDFLAHHVRQYLTNKSLDKDNRIVITGFDNNIEYSNVANNITTVDVQTETLGCRLANKIIFAINHPAASRELSYVESKILYRGALED